MKLYFYSLRRVRRASQQEYFQRAFTTMKSTVHQAQVNVNVPPVLQGHLVRLGT
jgi:hypothetical protein